MCYQSWHSVSSYRFWPLDWYRTELFNIGSVLQSSPNRYNRYRTKIRTDRCWIGISLCQNRTDRKNGSKYRTEPIVNSQISNVTWKCSYSILETTVHVTEVRDIGLSLGQAFTIAEWSLPTLCHKNPRQFQRQFQRERRIWNATARVIQKCFKGVIDCQERGWTLIPFWLWSVDRNKEDTKPFRTFIAPYTLRRYASYWQQYFIFSLRAIMVEDSIQWTARQQECLLELNSLIFQTDVDSEIEKKIFELSVLLI